MGHLYNLGIMVLSIASFKNIFFQPVDCFSFLCMVSFAVPTHLSLFRPHRFIFVFISITLGAGSRKILLWFISKSILPGFSCKTFLLPGLNFRSLTNFEFIWGCGARDCSRFILLQVAFYFPQRHSWKRLSFLHCICSCFLCCRFNDLKCVGLLLDFYPVPLIYSSAFVPLPSCSITAALWYSLKSGSAIPPLHFAFPRLFCLVGVFCVSTQM